MNRRRLFLSLLALLVLVALCAAAYAAGGGFMEMIQRHMGGM